MTAAGAETTAMRTPLQLWEREHEFVVLGLGGPMISPACRQVIFFVTASKISSCIFIARSAAALG
jgi:hypothetical protein